MDKIINWNKVENRSIYEQLKDKIQFLGEDTLKYYQKLLLMNNIVEFNEDEKRKYLKGLILIDNLENISDRDRLKMMLSYNVLVNDYLEPDEISYTKFFILANMTKEAEINEYGGVLEVLNNDVLDSITATTDDFSKQLEIASNVVNNEKDEIIY